MSTDIHALAGAYALDAVSDIERAQFDRHVAECDSCAQELAELRETVTRLSHVSVATPPPGLKRAVMAEVARTRQIPPGRLRTSTGRRGNRRDWRVWVGAAAAAVIIAVGAGIGGYSISNQRVDSARSEAAAAQARQAEISTIMSAPDARLKIVTMAASGSQVTLVISDHLNEGVAVLSHMPALHPDQAYQLWVIHGTKPVPAGVLAAGAINGTKIFTDVAGAGEFGISLEHAGGASSPQVPLVASFPI